MSGLYGNYFSKYKFPRVGISRRDLLYTKNMTNVMGLSINFSSVLSHFALFC